MVAELSQWLSEEGYGQYGKAKELFVDQGSPEDQPYLLKYKSRELLKQIKSKLEDFSEDGAGLLKEESSSVVSANEISLDFENENSLSVASLLAVVNYELGLNFVECEEVSTGEEYFKATLKLLQDEQSSALYSTMSMATNSQLAIICSKRALFEQSLEYLTLAEKEFHKLKEFGQPFIYFDEAWTSKNECDDRNKKLENLYTLTLYYMAQVFGSLGKQDISAKYCHITLSRQMEYKTYEPKDWSLNCATLSQYYITQEQYTLARYCLACAEIVNKQAVDSISTLEDTMENTKSQLEEKILKSKADIYRCWAKYGLNLLKDSHTKNVENGPRADAPVNTETKNHIDEMKELVFVGIEATLCEEQITDTFAKDYSEAKKLFIFSTKCLQEAKDFYKLDGYVSDFVEMTQDSSQLYKYLAFFDYEFDNRCKMHKRRIDMLKAILLELNPQHFLQICRQLTYELAEISGEMAELKKAIIEECPQKFSASSVKKINSLIIQAIKYYTAFIDTYKHQDKFPEKFEDDDVRGVLMCYFCMARLNNKYVTNDYQTKVKYLLQEKECYQFIVTYCDEHKDMPNVFDQELSICQEMLALHNAKMNKVLDNM